jgi:hypothetical protein
MTAGEAVRSGYQAGPPAKAHMPGPALIAVVTPQSCTYQRFDAQRRFLVTSIELWDEGVVVHVNCPTAAEAAALSNLLLEDNFGTPYECSSAESLGNRVMLAFSPAAPEGIRTLSVRPPHPDLDSPSSWFVAAVRLQAPLPRGGRFRRRP